MPLPDRDDQLGTSESRRAADALHGGILSGEAKKALAVYGQHLEWCNIFHAWGNRDRPCDCGLTALLSDAP